MDELMLFEGYPKESEITSLSWEEILANHRSDEGLESGLCENSNIPSASDSHPAGFPPATGWDAKCSNHFGKEFDCFL